MAIYKAEKTNGLHINRRLLFEEDQKNQAILDSIESIRNTCAKSAEEKAQYDDLIDEFVTDISIHGVQCRNKLQNMVLVDDQFTESIKKAIGVIAN